MGRRWRLDWGGVGFDGGVTGVFRGMICFEKYFVHDSIYPLNVIELSTSAGAASLPP